MNKVIKPSIVLGFFGLLFLFSLPTHAEGSSSVELEFTFASTLTTTLSSADIFIHDITPGTSKNSNSVNLNVTTNNITGYVVSASTGDANNNSSDLIQTGITDKFSSIAASANLESLTTDDTWGYSTKVDTTSGNGTSEQTVHTEGTWSNLNGLATTSAPIYSTNSPLIADVNFRITARASEDIEPGEYTNTINFFVVVNPAPGTFEDAFAGAGKTKLNNYYKMQDMTTSICNTVSVGNRAELIDTRDNHIYWVGKLPDNRCWLLDNLALDPLASGTTMSASDTNAPQNAINVFLNGGSPAQSGWSSYRLDYEGSQSYYDRPRIFIRDKDIIPQGDVDPLKNLALQEGWKVGIYYNFCAASVGTYCYSQGQGVDRNPSSAIDAEHDVCPAGWRMPTGGPISSTGTNAGGGEFEILSNAFPGDTESVSHYVDYLSALRAPLAGYYTWGNAYQQGISGSIWSSTYADGTLIYQLNYYSTAGEGSVIRNYGNERVTGFAVRCIAK